MIVCNGYIYVTIMGQLTRLTVNRFKQMINDKLNDPNLDKEVAEYGTVLADEVLNLTDSDEDTLKEYLSRVDEELKIDGEGS